MTRRQFAAALGAQYALCMGSRYTVDLPDELATQLQERVSSGEFESATDLVAEALRYYFERHRTEDWEEYVRKEVAWSRRHAG